MENNENIINDIEQELDGTKHYIFAPSISMRKIINGKSYYVKSYFAGNKDFEKTLKQLAINQAYNKMR